MEDMLLSVWDYLLLALSFTRSEEACSEEQQTVRDAGLYKCNGYII